MRVSEFLDMDFQDLNKLATTENREQAESVLKQMSRIANNRLHNLSKLDIPSPAFSNRTIVDSEGFAQRAPNGQFLYEEFQSTGNLREIRRELKYIKSFLESSTSTVKGARRYAEDVVMRAEGYTTRAEARRNMWQYEESKTFWSAMDKLKETDFNKIYNILGSGPSIQIVREVQEKHKPRTSDELWMLAKEELTRRRDEQMQAAYYAARGGE